MPLLGFQARFADQVQLGACLLDVQGWQPEGVTKAEMEAQIRRDFPGVQPKYQTIRARREDGRDPKPGDLLHLYVGLRTSKARKARPRHRQAGPTDHHLGGLRGDPGP